MLPTSVKAKPEGLLAHHNGSAQAPLLSITIILFDMKREAARSLHSLSASYRRNFKASDNLALVLDNGSCDPPEKTWVESFGPNFRYVALQEIPRKV
jgi:hypothetical protein